VVLVLSAITALRLSSMERRRSALTNGGRDHRRLERGG
jgi:hypothetical protein